ncbi:MAG: SRPBCC family protein [Marinobacter sp.]|uniref:SRPBCC family protein n=1 Tax=Marinobacter sp. TaxID=50741 RepID=UPI00299CF813|nr:SRPBCC family protein [Marinobacter sp.]MDX1755081.1 SRPBCC family protein [Marinobacter sp.]
MQFEHVVQVNDLTDTSITNLTRHQLWEGLVLRATSPEHFVIGLGEYEVQWQDDGRLQRSLELPGLVVKDLVTFDEERSVHYDIVPTAKMAGGSLTMTIEEPEPQSLFVRFRYCARYLETVGDDLPYDLFVQQAYIAADIDTIQVIRDRMTANGQAPANR